MSTHLAKLTAIHFYLNQLQQSNLVTPSIGIPYPPAPLNEEKIIMHRCHRRIQQSRINNIFAEIALLKRDGVRICKRTFDTEKRRFIAKLRYLQSKFAPDALNNTNNERRRRKNRDRNLKSRERYQARLYKKKFNDYMNKPESRTVYNLSNTNLSMVEILTLQLGHGFVPTPSNRVKDEELLILEGFRFIDRLGTIDNKLSQASTDNNNSNNSNSNNNNDNSNNNTNDNNNNDNNSNNSYNNLNFNSFKRSNTIPQQLQYYQPKEVNLSLNETKLIKKEFEDLNNKLIHSVNSKPIKRKKYNLPKKMRDAIEHLKSLVKDKVIDIRKVDKGQVILIIDYCQRIKAEELNISKIAKLCANQTSNWTENKVFVERNMKELYNNRFLSKQELVAVTGLIAGGVDGKKTNKDGSIKYTRAIASSELFSRHSTPYVYPLFKVHKMAIDELLMILPNNIATSIESRLVVGMSSCQLTRIQIWLEHFLSPLAVLYGSFEFIKDSNDFLKHIEDTKSTSLNENWDWSKFVLFTVDVKALYPSVKFEKLTLALRNCFNSCTNWNSVVITTLTELILYTLNNQQIYWNSSYYLLNQGIPTGGKHSVPLANIFLSYILKDSLDSNLDLKSGYCENVKLWKRFIDDCCGFYHGNINEFLTWYKHLQSCYKSFGLDLTCDTDSHTISADGEILEKTVKLITFLDIDVFKCDGTIHTKEHRKSTSVNNYLLATSAHPRHTFPGIIKSQLYRLRRLCSRDIDFKEAVKGLETRCINSGYNKTQITEILEMADTLPRNIVRTPPLPKSQQDIVRLVTLAGSAYINDFCQFASRMNGILVNSSIHIEIVRCTSYSLARLLFNNNDQVGTMNACDDKCIVCTKGLINNTRVVKSKVTGKQYKVDGSLNCANGGIYVIDTACPAQYTGKTTHFGIRSKEHFVHKSTAISSHMRQCNDCNDVKDFMITYVEDYQKRGKYSLSEREFLWNYRIKGSINNQKTLKS